MSNSTNKVEMHKGLCQKLNDIYERKNHDYGDSFHDTWVEEGAVMAKIRLTDKLNRFKTLTRNSEGGMLVDSESIEDTLLDLANYALMTVMEIELEKDNQTNSLPT